MFSKTDKTISKQLGVPITTAANTITKFKVHRIVATFPGCGHKRKTDPRQKNCSNDGEQNQ